MTLTSVSRYDRDRVSQNRDHAIVVGAGMAGLCAARVLADAFAEVTVVDRDPLPDEPVDRRGVPQAKQPHQMHEAGRATLEDLFPGFGEELLSAGGLVVDMASDMEFYHEGELLADGPKRLPSYTASRPLFEQIVRKRVADIDAITFRSGHQFVNYIEDETATAVRGVTVTTDDGDQTEIPAELVVDATGRTSRTPNWLENHGYETPPTDEIQIDVTYNTVAVERPPSERRLVVVPPEPPRTRGGGALPIEDDRWLVTIQGMYGDDVLRTPDEFVSQAADLPVPAVQELLETHEWVSDDIHHYPFTSNVRRRYEDLNRFPDGLVVVGDAIASINPLYGQGMSIAALEALLLHHAIAADESGNLALRFFDRIEEVVDIAWMIAVGGDLNFPQAEGTKPRGASIFDWYVSRLLQKARSDGTLRDAYTRVMRMEKPPTSLFRPGVVRRVLSPSG